MNSVNIEAAIARIERMEQYFDALQEKLKSNSACIFFDSDCKTMLQTLTDYYESGQWLRDYELDEQGALPQTLRRGVLSQDGLYNLLCELDDAQRK